MTEFERHWIHAEQEQHARLLYQLKREIIAKRHAEAAQANRQRPTPSLPAAISEAVPAAAAATETAHPFPKRPVAHSKPFVRDDWG